MFYAMQVAPRACNRRPDVPTAKLDANIAAQERPFGVTSAKRAAMLRQAENEIKSDPTSCAADGMLRTTFNEAVK